MNARNGKQGQQQNVITYINILLEIQKGNDPQLLSSINNCITHGDDALTTPLYGSVVACRRTTAGRQWHDVDAHLMVLHQMQQRRQPVTATRLGARLAVHQQRHVETSRMDERDPLWQHHVDRVCSGNQSIVVNVDFLVVEVVNCIGKSLAFLRPGNC